MAHRAFGQLEHTLYERRRRTRALLLLGVSLATMAVVMPAKAQAVINYSNGDNRTAAIAMTQDTVGDVALDETATQSGIISGAYKFSKAGFGALALSGNNTFSGGTDLNMGTLILRHDNALGTGLLRMAADTSLRFESANVFNLVNDVQIDGVAEWRGDRIVQTGVISGAGRLVVNANLTLQGQNTYTGGTDVTAGTLFLMNNLSMGAGAVNLANGTRLNFNRARAFSLTNDIALISGVVQFNVEGPANLAGVISGDGKLMVYGTGGDLVLAGTNTYSGGTSVNSGNVWVRNSSSLGTGSVFVGTDARLQLNDGVTLANALQFNRGAVLHVSQGTATLTGGIANYTPGGGFYKSGSGELVLEGAATNNGSTHIQTGVLTAATAGVLSGLSLHIIEVGGRLRLLADQSVGGLSGQGSVELGNHGLTLTSANYTSTFHGSVLGDADSSITMQGPNFLELGGDNAGFAGTLYNDGGSVYIAGDYSGMSARIRDGIFNGSGRVNDVVFSGGTLRGHQDSEFTMTSLVLAAESRVLAQLGNRHEGALFTVVNDLTLDGTLDVEDIGGFGPGIYRLFDYGGALTDNGIEIGDLPSGYSADELAVQTSMDGQINLVNSRSGVETLFWDGSDEGLWNNGRIEGGDGTWSLREDSFTSADGSTNAALNPRPGFVVFGGRAGTVTIDNEVGSAAYVTGLQFATSGYTVDGGSLTLADGEAIVRVGDGSAAGAGYVATINSRIRGSSTLIKGDLGTLVLNNNANDYSGGTLVRAGTLEVNGTIGDVLVERDGHLQGSGSVRDAEIRGSIGAGSNYPREASLAGTHPAAIGTLNVEGDLILTETSVFELDVDAAGNNDLVVVAGTAFLDGRVVTLASGGNYADATEYTFLRAENGIEGTFDGVSSNLAFLDAALAYNSNDVRLTLTRNGVTFGNIGVTANQNATGGAVEALGAGNAIYDRVLTLAIDDARAGFDQLSGEVQASLKGVLLTNSQALGTTMNDRVTAAFSRLGPKTDAPGTGLGIWSTASGSVGTLQSDGNAAATSFSAGNLFIGADAMFNQDWMLGVVAGYGQSGISIADRSSTARSDNYHVGIYGGGEVADFGIRFGAGYTQHDIDTNRTVQLPGFAEALFSSRSGGTAQFFGEFSRKFAFDSGLIIEPFANLAHASLYTGSWAEQGGTAALAGGASTASMTHLTLGLRGETDFALGDIAVTAKGMIGWRHALGNVAPTSTQAFTNGGEFTVSGSPLARDAAIIEAGLDFKLSPNVDLGVTYGGQFGGGLNQHGLKANLAVKF